MVAAKATGKERKMRTREIEVQFLYDELAVPRNAGRPACTR